MLNSQEMHHFSSKAFVIFQLIGCVMKITNLRVVAEIGFVLNHLKNYHNTRKVIYQPCVIIADTYNKYNL